MFGLLTGSTIFSVPDLKSGCYHIALDEKSKPTSASIASRGNMNSQEYLLAYEMAKPFFL